MAVLAGHTTAPLAQPADRVAAAEVPHHQQSAVLVALEQGGRVIQAVPGNLLEGRRMQVAVEVGLVLWVVVRQIQTLVGAVGMERQARLAERA